MDTIISPHIRVRHPEFFVVGEHSVVDDFCYFSTKVRIGKCSHVASGCSVAGGVDLEFRLGDFSSLSSGVKVWCGSDDFVNDVVTIIPPGVKEVKTHFISGNVTLGNYTAVGANSVIMPDNFIPEGTVIGAMSFVPPLFSFKPWSVYAGIPVRYLRSRNRKNIMEQVRKIEAALSRGEKSQ